MEFLDVNTPDGTMRLASATPKGPAKGAIIVIQEAFGLTEHIVSLTDRLALEGYRSVAPELFHRATHEPFSYDDYESLLNVIKEMKVEEIEMDLDVTLALLNSEGFGEDSIGMVGFCMGGSLALFSATRPGIGAAVTFYGGGVATGRFGLASLIDLAPSIRCPWLGLYGDLDQSIPVGEVEDLRVAAGLSAATTEIVRYEDAGHGFHCNDRPEHFNKESARDAWNRTLEFFSSHLHA